MTKTNGKAWIRRLITCAAALAVIAALLIFVFIPIYTRTDDQNLEQVMLRIRAERRITRGRAAILKAYLIKNTSQSAHFEQYKEALSVELNGNTNYQPYLLGRLFAVLEDLQRAANPGINTTIRDRFFNSACATPGGGRRTSSPSSGWARWKRSRPGPCPAAGSGG